MFTKDATDKWGTMNEEEKKHVLMQHVNMIIIMHGMLSDAHKKTISDDRLLFIEASKRPEGIYTPIHIACSQGNMELLKFFNSLEGLDWNVKDTYGRTPLHVACGTQEVHYEVVEYLLSLPSVLANIKVTGKEDPGFPLQLACNRGDEKLVKLFILSKKNILRNEVDFTNVSPKIALLLGEFNLDYPDVMMKE